MPDIVLFAAGSPVIVEIEETCARLGLRIAAVVRNVTGESHALAVDQLIERNQITAVHTALEVAIPLFGPARRQLAYLDALQLGFERYATLLDPAAMVAASAVIGMGTYVNAGAVVGAAARLGRFVFVNRGALLGHHLQTGDFVSIGPGANLAGEVVLENGVMLGAGVVVAPGVTIGANSVISIGSVVARNVPERCLVAGNPARIVKRGIAGYGGESVVP